LWGDNFPFGSIRFEFNDDEAILSYTIDKRYRGKGLGSIILKEGISVIQKEHFETKFIFGYVHENNKSSKYSFLKAGFKVNQNPPTHYENYNYYSLNILEK
jgi:RimJ/RimL family protein N-acetyltransferase